MQQSPLPRIRQTQTQAFSPSLIKGLQLLAMPYPALVSFLDRYALENPFLEKQDAWPLCGDPFGGGRAKSRAGGAAGMDPIPLFHSTDPLDTLYEHIRLQLFGAGLSARVLLAGLCAAEYIDERGYLCESAEAIAEQNDLSPRDVRDAIEKIKTFSPAGVGASCLRECLLLQADARRCDVSLMERVLDGPLEKLAARDSRYFARRLGVDERAVQAVFSHLSELSPHPGHGFESPSVTHYIYPEIEVFKRNGALSFSLQSGCDLVYANEPLYRELIARVSPGTADMEYIRSKYREASVLMQGLSLRRTTTEQLMLFMLSAQRDYFLHEGQPLRPVTMRQAADALGVTPSTISRCVNGRYIQTKDGVVLLKSLFAQRATLSADEPLSAAAVQSRIRAIIQTEPPHAPVSDQAIADRLAMDGARLARRTVAKYRDQMGIPTSRQRRQKGAVS